MDMSIAGGNLNDIFLPLRQSQQSAYIIVSSLVVFICDLFYTLPDEVEYIWKAKWSLPKVLYLMTRYWGILVVGCKAAIWFDIIGNSVVSPLVGVVLGLRIYALYGRSKKVLYFVTFLVACETGAQIYLDWNQGRETAGEVFLTPPTYPMLGCLAFAGSRQVTLVGWVTAFVVAGKHALLTSIFFGMTIYKLRKNALEIGLANSKSKTRPSDSPLIQAFIRGGALSFLLVALVFPINAGMTLGLNSPFIVSFEPWISLALSLAGTRLILTLRRADAKALKAADKDSVLGMETWEADLDSRSMQISQGPTTDPLSTTQMNSNAPTSPSYAAVASRNSPPPVPPSGGAERNSVSSIARTRPSPYDRVEVPSDASHPPLTPSRQTKQKQPTPVSARLTRSNKKSVKDAKEAEAPATPAASLLADSESGESSSQNHDQDVIMDSVMDTQSPTSIGSPNLQSPVPPLGDITNLPVPSLSGNILDMGQPATAAAAPPPANTTSTPPIVSEENVIQATTASPVATADPTVPIPPPANPPTITNPNPTPPPVATNDFYQPVPGSNPPNIHMDPLAHMEYLTPECRARWLNAPGDNILAYIFNDNFSPDGYEQTRQIRRMIEKALPNPPSFRVCHGDQVRATNTNGLNTRPAYAYLITGLPDAERHTLLDRQVWANNECAVRFIPLRPPPSNLAIVLNGFPSNPDEGGNEDILLIVQTILQGNVGPGFAAFVREHADNLPPHLRYDPPGAMIHIINSIEVLGIMMGNSLHYQGIAGVPKPRKLLNCNYCKAQDHPTVQCPFPSLTGWPAPHNASSLDALATHDASTTPPTAAITNIFDQPNPARGASRGRAASRGSGRGNRGHGRT
ncbi:hypothetical protein CVT24_000430 [Panaeolus cyanescens]|uniref:DUF6533 domain-containing protein n=1 Tax=Panaeolus cyanescens TaxID=181874 RepID=A0A409W754_9AGAR|nr:hypothetical protein CVT24_000430 [Panaeolus cyanescens]